MGNVLEVVTRDLLSVYVGVRPLVWVHPLLGPIFLSPCPKEEDDDDGPL